MSTTIPSIHHQPKHQHQQYCIAVTTRLVLEAAGATRAEICLSSPMTGRRFERSGSSTAAIFTKDEDIPYLEPRDIDDIDALTCMEDAGWIGRDGPIHVAVDPTDPLQR